MGRTPWRERPGYEDFTFPMERTGATWRFWVAGVLGALLLLSIVRGGDRSYEHANEWTPVMWFFFLPPMIALIVSGVGIRLGWEPTVLVRLLPLIVLVGMFVFGFALGGC